MNYFLEQVLPKKEAGVISGATEDINHYIGEIYFCELLLISTGLCTYGDFPIVTTVPEDKTEELVEFSKRAPAMK